MAVATVTDFNDILLEDVDPALTKLLVEHTEIWGRFKSMPARAGGRGWYKPFKSSRNTSFIYSDSALPAAVAQGYKRLTGGHFRCYARVHLDGYLMAIAEKGNPESLLDWAEGELDGLMEDIGPELDQSMVSAGYVLGFLTQHRNAGGAADWIFDGDYTKLDALIAVAAGGTLEVSVHRCDTWAAIGATYDGIDTTDEDGGTVHFTVNLDTSAITAAGVLCAVVVAEAAVIASQNIDHEAHGLLDQFGQITHFGLSRATYETLRPNLYCWSALAAGGRADMNRTKFQRMLNDAWRRAKTKFDEWWCHPYTLEAYADMVAGTSLGNVQISGERAGHADAGFSGYSFNGIPFVPKYHMPLGMIAGMKLNKRAIGLIRPPKFKPGFEDRGGGVLQPVTDKDEFSGFWKDYHELCMANCTCQALIVGMTRN